MHSYHTEEWQRHKFLSVKNVERLNAKLGRGDSNEFNR